MQVQNTPNDETAYPGCREALRRSFQQKSLQEDSIDILISSLTPATMKQYNSGLKNWWNFCLSANRNPLQPEVNGVLNYLTKRFKEGAAYGTLNSERSAINLLSSVDLGNDLFIIRFFKGIYKLRPTKPKYDSIWSTETLLKWSEEFDPLESLDLQSLTFKLVALFALATAHRVQTLSLIKIKNISSSPNGVEIRVTDQIKTSRVGTPLPMFFLPFFNSRKTACVASVLIFYLSKTKVLRGSIDNLFITIKKPHKAASSQTISRWIKQCLLLASIDKKYTAHSTRHAATSSADCKGIDINIIKSTAGWSEHSQVFARFYKRPITNNRRSFVASLFEENISKI